LGFGDGVIASVDYFVMMGLECGKTGGNTEGEKPMSSQFM